MWKAENREEFGQIVADLLAEPCVQALNEMSQHSTGNRLDHSVYVAYLSFLMCRRLRLDHVAAARAGLLHDFHFGSDENGVGRLWRHPHDAVENAKALCGGLSELERDIIVKHMWPLTRPLPRYRESFVVSLADKFAAALEFSRLYRLLRVKHKLDAAEAAA